MDDSARADERVVICGAGIAGLTLAWWLDRTGWDVLLLEKAPGLRDEGYMIDFFGSGYDVAERMGLLPALEAVQYDIPRVYDVDETGRPTASLEYDQFRRILDGRLMALMRGDLERVLFEALSENVEIRYERTVDGVAQDADGVDVTLDDGTVERAALLVGADGIHSRVRELVFGEEDRFLRYLGYHTAAYIFEDDAFRQRLDGDFRNLTVPNRIAGFYPIRGDEVASWFAFRAPEPTLPTDPCGALKRRFGDLGWAVPDALAHCGENSVYYDQVAQVEMDHWSRGRVTLVGDACYAVSLLAGQGASMAMGGAYVLAYRLRETGPMEERLALYETTMKPSTREKQASGRRMAGFFVPPTQWHLAARTLVLRLSGLPGLSRLLSPAVSGAESVLEDL